jgi:hypothetical protein
MTAPQITNELLAILLREEGWRVWNADNERPDESEHEDQYDVVLFKDWINCRDTGVQSAVRQLLEEYGARIS